MSDEVSSALKELDYYGYTVLPQFLKPEETQDLLGRVESAFSSSQKMTYSGVPERDFDDKIVYNLPAKDRKFLTLLLDPFVKSILMKKLNDKFYRFRFLVEFDIGLECESGGFKISILDQY